MILDKEGERFSIFLIEDKRFACYEFYDFHYELPFSRDKEARKKLVCCDFYKKI